MSHWLLPDDAHPAALPLLLGISIPTFWAATIALTAHIAPFVAEIVRSGVGSLPRGQQEAASALGLSWGQTMRSILLPQAITSMLPVLVSQLVVALKDTAIGYQITFVEMVRQGTVIGSTYGNYVPALIVIAVLMIGVNFALSAAATRLERRLRSSRRATQPLEGAAIKQGGAPSALIEPGD